MLGPTLLRLGGPATMLAGIALALGFLIHPAIPAAMDAQNPFSLVADGLVLGALALCVCGLAVLLVQHRRHLGRAAMSGLLLAIAGMLGTLVQTGLHVLQLPSFGGPGAAAGASVAGLVLIGPALARTRRFPRWLGYGLAVASLLFGLALAEVLPSLVFSDVAAALLGLALVGLGRIQARHAVALAAERRRLFAPTLAEAATR